MDELNRAGRRDGGQTVGVVGELGPFPAALRTAVPPYRPTALIALIALIAQPALAQTPDPISDNSFLVEEAYNQESHVVQHISTFSRGSDGGWLYTFTQEWPFRGMRNQLSYTIPALHSDGTGIGDIQLNYRLQALGNPDAPVALAPRLTGILPTGSSSDSRGFGSAGLQAALPASIHPVPALVFHLNAGVTWLPNAKNPSSAREAATTSYNLGASAIWLAKSRINFLMEWVWLDAELVNPNGGTRREQAMLLNPGVRVGFDFKSGLQIVPGVAYTVGVGPSDGEEALFLYLSFEHGF
ncbi:MAG TPA: transporter [Gemmatimonadales bacterium]|nr:transporter [Gemmatimonadales bacterium]